ncbi:MAG: gamma-butyrobetaine hydroxylase-like domain-containing protein [Magnetococcus sp. WYHC-3]
MPPVSAPIPEEIRYKRAEGVVDILWDDGSLRTHTVESLRVFCPCAECSGHQPSQAKLVDGKRHVTLSSIAPVGHYAVKFHFSDGHDSGVYSWDTLFELGVDMEAHWQEYLAALVREGKNRDVNTSDPPPAGCSTGGCGH